MWCRNRFWPRSLLRNIFEVNRGSRDTRNSFTLPVYPRERVLYPFSVCIRVRKALFLFSQKCLHFTRCICVFLTNINIKQRKTVGCYVAFLLPITSPLLSVLIGQQYQPHPSDSSDWRLPRLTANAQCYWAIEYLEFSRVGWITVGMDAGKTSQIKQFFKHFLELVLRCYTQGGCGIELQLLTV